MKFLWVTEQNGFEGCRFVRKKVFVEEQGFREDSEFDETDHTAMHLLVTDEEKPVAAARLFPKGNAAGVWQLGRICVLKEYRGTGLGAAVLSEAEQKAKTLGAVRVELGAQQRASGFYEKCGYQVCGEEYMDEFCPHVEMGKDL